RRVLFRSRCGRSPRGRAPSSRAPCPPRSSRTSSPRGAGSRRPRPCRARRTEREARCPRSSRSVSSCSPARASPSFWYASTARRTLGSWSTSTPGWRRRPRTPTPTARARSSPAGDRRRRRTTLGVVRTLCIDTSAGSAVALHDDGAGVLARARSADHRGHAERLSALVAEVLQTAGLSASAVDRVAVGTGPAPYTGLRVGLVTALTFARARGIPVHGVSSLDVLARQVLDVRPGSTVLVLGDARRKEVYSARYRALGDDDV